MGRLVRDSFLKAAVSTDHGGLNNMLLCSSCSSVSLSLSFLPSSPTYNRLSPPTPLFPLRPRRFFSHELIPEEEKVRWYRGQRENRVSLVNKVLFSGTAMFKALF